MQHETDLEIEFDTSGAAAAPATRQDREVATPSGYAPLLTTVINRQALFDLGRIGKFDCLYFFLVNVAGHTATVAEGNRIAYEWHDTLLAGFSAISWQLDEATRRQRSDPSQAVEAIDLARTMVDHYRSEARLVIADLLYEESDTNDLIGLIDQSITKVLGQAGVAFRIVPGGNIAILPPDISHQLLRICQEAWWTTDAVFQPTRKSRAILDSK